MKTKENKLTVPAEDYITTVYRLQLLNSGRVKLSDITSQLGTPASSATEMLQRLSNKKLLDYKPFKGVRLTKKGEYLARTIIRRHRIIERFLTDVLKVEEAQAHIEACKLEHNVSKLIAEKMYAVLKHPKYCPHGNLINIQRNKTEIKTINDLEEGKTREILGFLDERKTVLKKIQELGLGIGVSVKVIKKFKDDILIEILNNNQKALIKTSLAKKIKVSL